MNNRNTFESDRIQKRYKIEYIYDNVNELILPDRCKVYRTIYDMVDDKTAIVEKGDGISINFKYLNDAVLDEVFTFIQHKLTNYEYDFKKNLGI